MQGVELEANLTYIVRLLKKEREREKDPVSKTYQWRSIHLTMYRARFGL